VAKRYQVSLASVGADAHGPRRDLVGAVVEMGHFPIDLTGMEVLDGDQWDVAQRHLERSDYLVVIVGAREEDDTALVRRLQRAHDDAYDYDVPILGLLPDPASLSALGEETEKLHKKIRSNHFGFCGVLDAGPAAAVRLLNRLIDTYPRPGWVSGVEVPDANVASMMADLLKENEELRAQTGLESEEARTHRETLLSVLRVNKILIPLWERGATSWGEPIELSLYDFFVRMGPELAAEISIHGAAEFVPVGVCGLDREDYRAKWPVPSNNLNLWFTDLMALGLVEPSTRSRRAKAETQYWALTKTGRDLLSQIRRTVLYQGGQRHAGYTAEFPIVPNLGVDR
jgi:hypothetical protein